VPTPAALSAGLLLKCVGSYFVIQAILMYYSQLEAAGFEVKNVDVIGVHYSATIYRWYKNWLANKDKVIPKYGEKLYRIWLFFLAWSTLIARYVSNRLACYCICLFLFFTSAMVVRAVSKSHCTRISMLITALRASRTTPPSNSPLKRRSRMFHLHRLLIFSLTISLQSCCLIFL